MIDIAPWLRKVSIFLDIAEDSIQDVANITEFIRMAEETSVFEEGDTGDALYVIVSGQVRIEKNYRDGRHKTLAFLSSGHFFGEMAIISECKRCATAVISEEAELLKVEKSAFLALLKHNNELCFNILQVVCDRLRTADTEIGNLTFRNLPGRIVSKLFELSEQFGTPHEQGTLINLDITHYDLADMVGTNRESISKYMSKFKKEGAIQVDRKKVVVVDRKKLAAWS